MRKLLLAVLSILLSGAAALGADYRPGPYLGIEIGAASEQLTTDNLDLSKQGLQVGGVAGWTFRTADLVLGFEGSFGWNGVTGSWSNSGFTAKSDGSWRGNLRARAGVPFGPALIFVTTGPAFQSVSTALTSDGVGFSDSKVIYGIAAGAGIDLQITQTTAIRISGEHTWWKSAVADFGSAGSMKTSSEDSRLLAAFIFNLN